MKIPILSSIFGNRQTNSKLKPLVYSTKEQSVSEQEEGRALIAKRDKWLSLRFDDEEQNVRLINKYYNAYLNFPIVAAAVDSKVEQVVQDFRFEGPDARDLTKWADTINLRHHLRKICRDGLIAGTYWAEKVLLDEEKKGLGRLKDPVSFKHIDSRTMRTYRTPKGKLICYMQEANSKKIYWGALTNGLQADKGGEIEDMFCWKWNVVGSNKYGTSIIHSAIPMLEIKDQMETDMKSIIKRYIAPLIHAKIGDELHPANATDVGDMQSQLEDIYADTEYVTNHLVDMTVLDFKNKGVDPTPIFEHIDSQILVGLQTHSIMLATEMGKGSGGDRSAEIRLRANGRHIRAIQDELKLAIEDQVLFPMTGSKKNHIVWESVEERQFEADVDIITTLVKNGIITRQKANEMLPDQYRETLPKEFFSNVLDQKVPSDEKVDNPTDPTKSTRGLDGKRVDKSEHFNIPNAKSKPQEMMNVRML